MLINLDQLKALDWVDYQYFAGSFRMTSFGPSLRNWVVPKYGDTSSEIRVNVHQLEALTVIRSVRQMYPFSRYLYIVTLDTLL